MLMKRKYLFLILLLISSYAHALLVSVNGYDAVPEEGLNITIDKAELDILSGKMQMGLKGNLVCSGTLTVTISRSSAGLEDEFCCAGQCTAGNEETSETLEFYPNGLAEWYVHYNPLPNSDETIVYRFTEGEESRVITVRYIHTPGEGLDNVSEGSRKTGVYTLTGTRVQETYDGTTLPDGAYIINGKKTILNSH